MSDTNIDLKHLENELADAILQVFLKNKVHTGYHENGHGKFLDINIDFKYLNNHDIMVTDLEVESKISEYNKEI